MLMLEDDGTLDTVIHCTVCGETGRYNTGDVEDQWPEDPTEVELEELDRARVDDAMRMAEEDHAECLEGE